ncbi:MAG: ATP-dependent endonuclease [Dehalococcoidia bacterium]
MLEVHELRGYERVFVEGRTGVPEFEIRGFRFQNLRGFRDTRLPLVPRMVLVGPNNAGKTSLCKLLDILFNLDEEAITGRRELHPDELASLEPARDTRGTARRITVDVHVNDGRRWSRFHCDQFGICRLRIGIRDRRMHLNLRPPTRSTDVEEPEAWAILKELRARYQFLWVPAGRDATTTDFKKGLHENLSEWMKPKLNQNTKGGKPREYRDVLKVKKSAEEAASGILGRFLKEVHLDGIGGVVSPVIDMPLESVGEWLLSAADLRFTTGDHDIDGVSVEEVGSGLQSLVIMALRRRSERTGRRLILGVEEPESHLHPALTRRVARELLRAPATIEHVLVSTHSSQVVSEAEYGQTVILKRHRFYVPDAQSDARRAAINSVLMEDRAAEFPFSEATLLVEGERDRRFFEAVRRRLAAGGADVADKLFVLDVGGNTRFGPWLRLFRSYGIEGDRPVSWLALFDGDATGEAIGAIQGSGVAVPAAVRSSLNTLGAVPLTAAVAREKAASDTNRQLEVAMARVLILPVDLEWAALARCPDKKATEVAGALGLSAQRADELAGLLGSKVLNGKSDGTKAPWMGRVLGEMLSSSHWSATLVNTVKAWLEGAGEPRAGSLVGAL